MQGSSLSNLTKYDHKNVKNVILEQYREKNPVYVLQNKLVNLFYNIINGIVHFSKPSIIFKVNCKKIK
jgi:hypothetical protein